MVSHHVYVLILEICEWDLILKMVPADGIEAIAAEVGKSLWIIQGDLI
jgi:hypothetical protein